jgi:hypothetical protein
MPALAVGEVLDVLEERRTRVDVGAEGPLGEQFTLQGRKEAFRHGVVVTIAHRPHRAADAHRLTAFPQQQRSVLAAMIRMVDEASVGTAVPNRHLERPHRHLGAEMRGHRPAHHPPTEHVEDHRQIEEIL